MVAWLSFFYIDPIAMAVKSFNFTKSAKFILVQIWAILTLNFITKKTNY